MAQTLEGVVPQVLLLLLRDVTLTDPNGSHLVFETGRSYFVSVGTAEGLVRDGTAIPPSPIQTTNLPGGEEVVASWVREREERLAQEAAEKKRLEEEQAERAKVEEEERAARLHLELYGPPPTDETETPPEGHLVAEVP